MPTTTEQKDLESDTSAGVILPSDDANYPGAFQHMDIEPVAQEQASPNVNMTVLAKHLETVIIFDWDDTLLASTFLSSKGYRLDNAMVRCPEVEAQLRLLEASVVSVLTTALLYGPVHVITNAETGWVQLSAQKFMPAVVPLLDKVTVVSARSTYEPRFPEAPLQWKLSAFEDRINRAVSPRECGRSKNIISFGDSHVEREAVRSVTRGWDLTTTKSVKFAERPSMEQLRRQLDLVSSCFQFIYAYQGDLDLMLTISLVC